MIGSFDFGSLVDMAFVAVVTLACGKMLLQSEDHRTRWKRELLDLHASLKDLIGEAASASHSLDRNLLRRQQELQSLLTKITEAQEHSQPTVKSADLDVPNSTWLERKAQPSAPEKPTLLQQKIEVTRVRSNQEYFAPNELQRLRSIDATALKVAKRLLSQETPIHIVARKVELAPADVRLIDRLMRFESGNPVPIPTDDENAAIELSEAISAPAQLIEAKQRANGSPARVNDEWYIEQEQVLL